MTVHFYRDSKDALWGKFYTGTDNFEAMNKAGEQFGAKRVGDVFRQHPRAKMSEIVAALAAAVDSFVGDQPQADDMTIVLTKRLDPSSG